MLELFEYLLSIGYKVSRLDNGRITISSITTNEVLSLVKGINFNTQFSVEAVLVESLTYELRKV